MLCPRAKASAFGWLNCLLGIEIGPARSQQCESIRWCSLRFCAPNAKTSGSDRHLADLARVTRPSRGPRLPSSFCLLFVGAANAMALASSPWPRPMTLLMHLILLASALLVLASHRPRAVSAREEATAAATPAAAALNTPTQTGTHTHARAREQQQPQPCRTRSSRSKWGSAGTRSVRPSVLPSLLLLLLSPSH